MARTIPKSVRICLFEYCVSTENLVRGLCSIHYNKATREGRLEEFSLTKRQNQELCSVEGCASFSRKVGMCSLHYSTLNETGIRAAKKAGLVTRLRNVGWTLDRWIAFNYAQGGLCSICFESDYSKGNNMRLAADHDHETGEPRGLLCKECNQRIGTFENNKSSILSYLGLNV